MYGFQSWILFQIPFSNCYCLLFVYHSIHFDTRLCKLSLSLPLLISSSCFCKSEICLFFPSSCFWLSDTDFFKSFNLASSWFFWFSVSDSLTCFSRSLFGKSFKMFFAVSYSLSVIVLVYLLEFLYDVQFLLRYILLIDID